jgi:hypothetical protein
MKNSQYKNDFHNNNLRKNEKSRLVHLNREENGFDKLKSTLI